MSIPPVGTPFSDVAGFEGITHGVLPNIVNHIGALGYGLQASVDTPKEREVAATPAPAQTFTLDF